jgi:hypothetical protein
LVFTNYVIIEAKRIAIESHVNESAILYHLRVRTPC